MQLSETESSEKMNLDQDISLPSNKITNSGIEVFRNQFICGDTREML